MVLASFSHRSVEYRALLCSLALSEHRDTIPGNANQITTLEVFQRHHNSQPMVNLIRSNVLPTRSSSK